MLVHFTTARTVDLTFLFQWLLLNHVTITPWSALICSLSHSCVVFRLFEVFNLISLDVLYLLLRDFLTCFGCLTATLIAHN